jgi:ABC-type branched-subunit amino acid transport system substrate-binding protein
LAAFIFFLGLGGCATVGGLPEDPSAAPLRERALETAERERLRVAAAQAGSGAARALYYLGLDQAAGGDWKGAGETWQRLLRLHPNSGWDRLAQFKIAQTLEHLGDAARAFVQYQGLLTGTAVADLPERSRAACLRLLESMPPAQLRSLAAGPWVVEEFRAPLALRRIETDLAEGLSETARAGIEAYLSHFPSGPYLDRIEELSRALDAAVPVNPHVLGLVVPLGGPYAALGRQIRQGVELALAQANQDRPEEQRYSLRVADEGGTTATALEAARRLVEQEQVVGLLGPLSSDAAQALGPFLNSRRVPMLSPAAPAASLAGLSPWFFRNSLGPLQEAEAMADYSVLERRLTRVACVVPDTPLGRTMAGAYAARMQALGAPAPALLTYTPHLRDFKALALELGGVDPSEAKNAEADEKREQQARVEEASTALGRFLLAQAKSLTPAAGLTLTPQLRLLVVDFAEDTACAELNAGRAFGDRFRRTLAQLPELEVLGPEAAQAWRQAKGLSTSAMDLPQLQALGQALTVHYILSGGCAAAQPERSKRPRDRWFNVVAQVLDPQTGALPVYRRFAFGKYVAPPANPQGWQALYLPIAAEDLARLKPALTFCEMDLPLLGSDQWLRPDLQGILPELEGAVLTAPYWGESPDSAVRRFEESYAQAYAERPGLLAAQAYDAARLFLSRLDGGVRNRTALRDALARVDGWKGVSGRTSFAGRQDAVKRPAFLRVHNGALEILKEP